VITVTIGKKGVDLGTVRYEIVNPSWREVRTLLWRKSPNSILPVDWRDNNDAGSLMIVTVPEIVQFLEELMRMEPLEAIDLLTNFGEDVLDRWYSWYNDHAEQADNPPTHRE
jgi:hypothetical protein